MSKQIGDVFFFPILSHIKFSEKCEVTAQSLAVQLHHKSVDDNTSIAKVDGVTCSVRGCISVTTPLGNTLYGNQVYSIVEKGACSKDELFEWLKGDFSTPALDKYLVSENVEVIITNNGTVVASYDSLPQSKEAIFAMMGTAMVA
jgi:hypothetical protein